MTYQQTLDYLYNRLPMFSRVGVAAYKKDLDNTIILCQALGEPQHKFRSIHVAGTNGKGSTSHMLAAILQTAGYKTGLYTSPHLKDFRERIKIDGKEIDEEFVIEFVHRVQPLAEKIEPSFFEITVAMAFQYFAHEKVDIAVIETGLGGRLDSTNIITPEVAVITNIGMDHMNLLGNNIESIAVEKAGIIKDGVPVVIGETTPVTKEVFTTKAKLHNTKISIASEELWISDWSNENNKLVATVAHHQLDEDRQTYQLDLAGMYQLKNLLTVIRTITELNAQGWNISQEHIKTGLAHVKKLTGLHGRWEMIQQSPTVILDVAHNEDGIKQLAAQLEHEDYRKVHIVIGMVKDKEIDKVLALLPQQASYYFTNAKIERALPAIELMAAAAKHNLHGHYFGEVNTALQQAIADADKDDLILVCGSVYVVGELN
jgi:dihydrofolate synthase / folylpolyglutamate synthase